MTTLPARAGSRDSRGGHETRALQLPFVIVRAIFSVLSNQINTPPAAAHVWIVPWQRRTLRAGIKVVTSLITGEVPHSGREKRDKQGQFAQADCHLYGRLYWPAFREIMTYLILLP